MRDIQHGGQTERSSEELSALAQTVVARLAGRAAGTVRPLSDGLVKAMAKAIASPNPAAFDALRPEIRRSRIAETELVDRYFPAVARQLGNNWEEDRSSWADVSIGMARLQSLVHQIGREWSSNASPMVTTTTALVILPEGEQHSFGVQLLAGQLRRMGVSVHLQIGGKPKGLRTLLKEHRYDCAMVSIGCEERLELCRQLVRSLKDGSDGHLCVAVGGVALDRMVDVQAVTKADLTTNDPVQVLAAAHKGMCKRLGGLPIDNRADVLAATEQLGVM